MEAGRNAPVPEHVQCPDALGRRLPRLDIAEGCDSHFTVCDPQPFARRCYMTAAVRALVPFAFGTLRLHRLEAACIPTNNASIGLLEKTDFVREGYARDYLCINGIWQDHLLYGRLKDAKH